MRPQTRLHRLEKNIIRDKIRKVTQSHHQFISFQSSFISYFIVWFISGDTRFILFPTGSHAKKWGWIGSTSGFWWNLHPFTTGILKKKKKNWTNLPRWSQNLLILRKMTDFCRYMFFYRIIFSTDFVLTVCLFSWVNLSILVKFTSISNRDLEYWRKQIRPTFLIGLNTYF